MRLCPGEPAGTYIVSSASNAPIAVFKPADEELFAVNNPNIPTTEEYLIPKGHIEPSTGWRREVASYLLDHDGFAMVPVTAALRVPQTKAWFKNRDNGTPYKQGSVQEYISAEGNSNINTASASDFDHSLLLQAEVHRVAILDIRLLNCDRTKGNLLLHNSGGVLHLRPICNGFTFPLSLGDMSFCWMNWPQAKEPLSEEELQYISNLDPTINSEQLCDLGIEEEAIDLHIAATMLLKMGTKRGLSLKAIAQIMVRPTPFVNSQFEELIVDARRSIDEGGRVSFDALDRLLHAKLSTYQTVPSPLTSPQNADNALLSDEYDLKSYVSMNGVKAVLANEGEGGTYFIEAEDETKLAVFKPADEEPGGLNNPRGNTDAADNSKGAVVAGTGVLREVAAYRLDHGHWAGVPKTIPMEIPNALFAPEFRTADIHSHKHGSLQSFVTPSNPNDQMEQSWSLLPGRFPVEDVHKIGVFDVRVLNCDRHGGNILATGSNDTKWKLHPIDHSFILPNGSLGDLEFEWLMWPQSRVPFSEETLQYIENLDVEKDIRTLQELGIEAEAQELLRVSTLTLKLAATAGWTLREIGDFCRRTSFFEVSPLEQCIIDARRPLDETELSGTIDFEKLGYELRQRVRPKHN